MTDPEKKLYIYKFPELIHKNHLITGLRNSDRFINFKKKEQVLSISKEELVTLFNKSETDQIDVIT